MQSFNSNISDVIQRFKNVQLSLRQVDVSEALLVGVNAAMAQMKYRIFTEGMDASGRPLGAYTGKNKKGLSNNYFKGRKKEFLVGRVSAFSPYELKRIKAGHQIRYKDLEFFGALRRGIVVIRESNVRIICAIPSNDLALLAAYQEEQIAAIRNGGRATPGNRIKIFGLSADERELLNSNTLAALNQIYARVLHP